MMVLVRPRWLPRLRGSGEVQTGHRSEIKRLSVIDEFTRECLVLTASRGSTGTNSMTVRDCVSGSIAVAESSARASLGAGKEAGDPEPQFSLVEEIHSRSGLAVIDAFSLL